MRVVVVDLDGTLCDARHREEFARAREWDEFHSRLGADEPWPDVRFFLSLLCEVEDLHVIGCTGRNARYALQTVDWLLKHNICLEGVLMRPDDDYRPDHELKVALLREWLQPHDEVLMILDDRDKVVEAWRDAGFNCWQVRPGGY